MTNSLWRPPIEVVEQIKRGNRIAALNGREVLEVDCPYCHKQVKLDVERRKLLTLNGSPHNCKGMKRVVTRKGIKKLDDKLMKLARWRKSL